MNLKKLFESELLNDETKTVIQEAFTASVAAQVEEAKAEMQQEFEEKVADVTKMSMDMVEEAIGDEVEAIAQELAEARTLDVKYAARLTQFKEDYAVKQEALLSEMVDERIAAELEELKEDIEMARRHKFSQRMFESFREAFETNFGQEEASGENLEEQLREAREELAKRDRADKIDSLLEGLTGTTRMVAETLLEGVATDKLDGRFESIKGLLIEGSAPKEEGEVVTEGAEGAEAPKGTVVVEGAEHDSAPKAPSKYAQALEAAVRRSRG